MEEVWGRERPEGTERKDGLRVALGQTDAACGASCGCCLVCSQDHLLQSPLTYPQGWHCQLFLSMGLDCPLWI